MIILIIIEYTFRIYQDKLKMIMQTNLLIYYQEWKHQLVKYMLFLRHLQVLLLNIVKMINLLYINLNNFNKCY